MHTAGSHTVCPMWNSFWGASIRSCRMSSRDCHLALSSLWPFAPFVTCIERTFEHSVFMWCNDHLNQYRRNSPVNLGLLWGSHQFGCALLGCSLSKPQGHYHGLHQFKGIHKTLLNTGLFRVIVSAFWAHCLKWSFYGSKLQESSPDVLMVGLYATGLKVQFCNPFSRYCLAIPLHTGRENLPLCASSIWFLSFLMLPNIVLKVWIFYGAPPIDP